MLHRACAVYLINLWWQVRCWEYVFQPDDHGSCMASHWRIINSWIDTQQNKSVIILVFVLCLVLRRRNWQISPFCLAWCLQSNEKGESFSHKLWPQFNPGNVSVSTCLTLCSLRATKWQNVRQTVHSEREEGERRGRGGREKQMSWDANSQTNPICFAAVLQHVLALHTLTLLCCLSLPPSLLLLSESCARFELRQAVNKCHFAFPVV